MTLGADTAAWIGIGAGVVSAVAALAGLYAVLKSFRPRLRARIDGRRQAIRVDVANAGRAGGRISGVAVVRPDMEEVDATFAALPDGRFKPAEIPGRSGGWHLIVGADRQSGGFPDDVLVRVSWGLRGERLLEPEPAPDVSYHGMASQWP